LGWIRHGQGGSGSTAPCSGRGISSAELTTRPHFRHRHRPGDDIGTSTALPRRGAGDTPRTRERDRPLSVCHEPRCRRPEPTLVASRTGKFRLRI